MNTNILRLIAITLPMTLLLACGGGGGGTAAAPTAMMPDMPGPVTLPGYAITNLDMARMAVDGTEPADTTEMEIVSGIQDRATVADYFEFEGFTGTPSASITCSDSSTCSGTIPDVGDLAFSLAGIEDLSLVDDANSNLVGFNSESQVVMEDRGVTMIQSRSAARQSDGTLLSFQTYGGWLTASVFGVELLTVTENDVDTDRYASFSFGQASGSRPTGRTTFQWAGVMVGRTATGDILHGEASASYDPSAQNILDQIIFNRIKNLDTGKTVFFNGLDNLQFNNIDLETDGTFEKTESDGYIKGSFYGSKHESIGGVFNRSNIVGAFGGVFVE